MRWRSRRVAWYYVRVFLITGGTFGAIALATGLSLPAALWRAAVFGGLMTLGLGPWHVAEARRAGQADPNPVRHRVLVDLPLDLDAARERGRSLLVTMPQFRRFVGARGRGDRIEGVTGFTWMSWGERIGLAFEPEGGHATRVTVESRPRLWPSIGDGGRNFQNVHRLAAKLTAAG